MTIKIEYEIELTDAQAKSISQLVRVPMNTLNHWLQGYLHMAGLMRLRPWIGDDIEELLRKARQ